MLVLLALAGCAGGRAQRPPQTGPTAQTEQGIARPYGHGTSAVWVLTPKAGKPRSIVVFIHGWTATSPFDWHQAWLDHLLGHGSAVVFPVYQVTGDWGEVVTSRFELRAGLRTAFRVLGDPHLPVVVAGYSVGGALAFYYAADAHEWGIPTPRAVYSIFPLDPFQMDPGLLHLGRPPHVRTLILVADKDTTVGSLGADAFWKWLRPVPRALKTYRLLHSDPKGEFFDHESPHLATFNPEMRKVFWDPLDRLVARVGP